jgi:SAM-dependent methyltransferase
VTGRSKPSTAIRAVGRRVVPAGVRAWLREQQKVLRRAVFPWRGNWTTPGHLTPFSIDYGTSRGQPIDRCYIESFLEKHAQDIRGHVLEFGNDFYTRRFGGARVTCADVLNRLAGSPQTTIVGDLADAPNIAEDTFDCIICTQVLQYLYELRPAVATLHRILKPGGVILVTVPGVAHKLCREDMDEWGDYWRFTGLSVKRLFEDVFGSDHAHVESRGNVLAASAFLQGLAVEDVSPSDLEFTDPDYEVSIAVRAEK